MVKSIQFKTPIYDIHCNKQYVYQQSDIQKKLKMFLLWYAARFGLSNAMCFSLLLFQVFLLWAYKKRLQRLTAALSQRSSLLQVRNLSSGVLFNW